MRSLETSLHLGLALSLMVLIGGAWWLGHLALHRTADAFVVSRLQHDAEALLAGIDQEQVSGSDPEGLRLSARTAALAIYDRPYSGHYYVIQPESGKPLRSRSLWDHDLPLPPLAVGETREWRAAGPENQDLLVWAAAYSRGSHRVTLATAEDVTPLTNEVDHFEHSFSLIALAGLVLAILVQRLVVRRALSRLRPVYGEIERLERGAVGRLTEVVPKELLPLVHKINHLLGSYAKRLERSRQTAGNLAHTIKGPLSVLTQQIERDEARLPAALARGLREQVHLIGRRMDRELKRARLAGEVSAGQHFDAAADLPALTDLLRRIYRDKDLEIGAEATPGVFPADREDMLELLGVLADNACKWARRRVRLQVALGTLGLGIQIEDDGPGAADEDLATLTSRGVRLDEGVSGQGLGLAIAQEIVQLYGGSLHLGRSRLLGGFAASVKLPYPGIPSD